MSGLNFRTQRSRQRIVEDLITVISTVYEPKRYLDRILRLSKRLKAKTRHRPRAFAIKRDLLAFMKVTWAMTKDGDTRYYFWRNFAAALRMGPAGVTAILDLMGAYVHFKQQVRYTVAEVRRHMPAIIAMDREPAERAGEVGSAELVILHDRCA
jgi:hypothetical protein